MALFWVSALCAPGLYVVGIEEHPLAWLVVFGLMFVAILVIADADPGA
jgi:hypothetical protein